MGRRAKKTKAEAIITSVVEIPLALVQVGSKLERAHSELTINDSRDELVDALLSASRGIVDSILQFISGGADLSKLESLFALPDIEEVSALVHQAWIDSKLAQGIESRKAEDGEELMVFYGFLSEKAKELDRATVRAVYGAIEEARESK